MDLLDIVKRYQNPQPWSEGEKIPWQDPAFSERMLSEHLSQEHDAASRRSEIIDAHVTWIHQQLLNKTPSKILDLGCGPGLYTHRLSKLGHACLGIDYAPASIEYAKSQADTQGLPCRFVQEDIRASDYGQGYGLVMLIFGEFNVFRPQDAKKILQKSYLSLNSKGLLLLEPHTFESVKRLGESPSTWHSSENGLFSSTPHLVLKENYWDADKKVTTERYYVVDAESGSVATHAASIQAYSLDEYIFLLRECGFGKVEIHPSLDGENNHTRDDFFVLGAQKG